MNVTEYELHQQVKALEEKIRKMECCGNCRWYGTCPSMYFLGASRTCVDWLIREKAGQDD